MSSEIVDLSPCDEGADGLPGLMGPGLEQQVRSFELGNVEIGPKRLDTSQGLSPRGSRTEILQLGGW